MTAPEQHVHDAVIVGGGIAGLSAAWDLRNRDVLVLEASDRPGGGPMPELMMVAFSCSSKRTSSVTFIADPNAPLFL